MSDYHSDGSNDDRSADETDSHEVTVEFEDEETTLTVGADEYILDAAHDAGLDLPYSCREGNCTTCVAELGAGEVDQHEGMALDPEDREDYVLLCSAYPRSDCRVEAGEHVQSELLGLDVF